MFEKYKNVFGMCVCFFFFLKKLVCVCLIKKKADIYPIQNKFFYLMRADGLKRGRGLTRICYIKWSPRCLKVFTILPFPIKKNVVYCLKRGHGWFQKISFKNYIFNNNFQATLNTVMFLFLNTSEHWILCFENTNQTPP